MPAAAAIAEIGVDKCAISGQGAKLVLRAVEMGWVGGRGVGGRKLLRAEIAVERLGPPVGQGIGSRSRRWKWRRPENTCETRVDCWT